MSLYTHITLVTFIKLYTHTSHTSHPLNSTYTYERYTQMSLDFCNFNIIIRTSVDNDSISTTVVI